MAVPRTISQGKAVTHPSRSGPGRPAPDLLRRPPAELPSYVSGDSTFSDCGGRLRLIGTLHDPAVIRKILV